MYHSLLSICIMKLDHNLPYMTDVYISLASLTKLQGFERWITKKGVIAKCWAKCRFSISCCSHRIEHHRLQSWLVVGHKTPSLPSSVTLAVYSASRGLSPLCVSC